MSDVAFFELLAAICALAASVVIFDQHLHRPRPHKLMWTLGLLFYGIAAAAAFAGAASHWTVTEYKLWYYFGGVLTAVYLGLGSFYLLGTRRIAHIITGVVVLLALYAGIRILSYSVPPEVAAQIAASTTTQVTNVSQLPVLPGDLKFVTVPLNIFGSIFLFGGALWTAWTFVRSHTPGYRVLSMILLALGAIFPVIGTGLQPLGYSAAAPLAEFLGALCLLTGLLVSHDVFTVFRIPFTQIVLRERRQPVSTGQR